jgi:WD40 repeat protein
VWDLSDGRVVAELKGHKFGVSCLAFAPSPPHAPDDPPLLVRPLLVGASRCGWTLHHLVSRTRAVRAV